MNLRPASLAQGFALAAAMSAAIVAQTRTAPTPRTPWGKPHLQGTYTNTYEASTPLERPDQFAGRKLEEAQK